MRTVGAGRVVASFFCVYIHCVGMFFDVFVYYEGIWSSFECFCVDLSVNVYMWLYVSIWIRNRNVSKMLFCRGDSFITFFIFYFFIFFGCWLPLFSCCFFFCTHHLLFYGRKKSSEKGRNLAQFLKRNCKRNTECYS